MVLSGVAPASVVENYTIEDTTLDEKLSISKRYKLGR